MIVQVPRLPHSGETIIGGRFITAAGGKGANQAVGAARAGGEVTFIARVGNDLFGNQALSDLAKDGIQTDFVMRDEQQPSGVALIFVAKDGQNNIAVAPGANARLSPVDVNRAGKAFAHADVLLTQLETPLETVIAAAGLAVQHKLPVILNPAPAQPMPDALLRCVSILTPNEREAETLTGIRVKDDDTAAKVSDKLHAHGVATIVITLGPRGAFVSDKDGGRTVPGFKVKAVDTTAAGDIFNGALAVALAERRPLLDAVRFANAAAALSVTHLGAQASAPARDRIESLLAKGG
jgi:ribokinase